MGVKGLWELLHPVARPIKLENLSNKHLAIDASIWLHQFLRGMRDKEGQAIGNAHIIGFFRRICKLLYYNVKPIFVFDGGTPALKRLTIQERRKRKKQDANMVKRTAEKLLAAQLRLRALEQRKAGRKKKTEAKQNEQQGIVHDSDKNPKYLQELQSDGQRATAIAVLADAMQPTSYSAGGGTGSQAKRNKDKYLLPPMEVDFDTLSKIRSNDERFAYQEEDDVSHFLNEFKKEGGVANIDSDVFKALPSEMQYEILHDIRLRSRVTSYERVQEMVRLSETPMDFSKLQVQGVIRRNNVTHKLLSVNQAVSKSDDIARPGRIASQRSRQYILIKNEEGGWVLGGKKPTTGTTADKPVQLDSDDEGDKVKGEEDVKEEDEEEWESDDEDVDFEEVKIPVLEPAQSRDITARPDVVSRAKSGSLIAPKLTAKANDSNSLIHHLDAYVDEDESIEKVMAKFAEIENEATRKRGLESTPLKPTQHMPDGTNEKNGLHLIDEQDTGYVQDGAQEHLAKAGLRPKSETRWAEAFTEDEEVGSMDTMNSLDTMYSDNTFDYEDLEEMVEDERNGEVMSRRVYNKHRQQQQPGGADESTGRALSLKEEAELDQQAFHSYWTGYTPDCFKIKYQDHEFIIKEVVDEWDEDRLATEMRSAARKLEKSNTNDIIGVEALKFWKSFLQSSLNRRQTQLALTSSIQLLPVPAGSISSTVKKSRLSQSILLDDDDGDESKDAELEVANMDYPLEQEGPVQLSRFRALSSAPGEDSPIPVISASVAKMERTKGTIALDSKLPPEDLAVPRPPALDFSSSILKRRVPAAQSELSNISSTEERFSKTKSEVVPVVVQSDEGIDVGTGFDASASDSGVGSLPSSPAHDIDITDIALAEKADELDNEDVKMDEGSATAAVTDGHLPLLDDDASFPLEGQTMEDENIDDEEESHDADLENEEEDFSKLFPDMANLPGVLSSKGPAILLEPQQPTLSAEEKASLDQQEATKMFEESRQLESEIKVLRDQHRKHQRDADDLTESMVAETQMLLRLFGIPYLVAPMEAEAQCADLQLRGVVDGILTEDSDVFLFGGARVFKNMFREEKYVECYLMSDIERDLGVGRDRLVALAYLLGSDYTTGIKGVGLVTAMEIIRLFPKLENFARWWKGEQHRVGETGTTDSTVNNSGLTEMELDSIDEVALEKLAKQCKKIHVPSSFPDPHVADAYIHPLVDDDPTKFQWGIPDLDGLRDYLRKSLDWDRGEVDRVLLPIIRQMASAQSQTQTTLDGFFDATVGTGSFQPLVKKPLHKSFRLRKVVDGLRGQIAGNNSRDGNEEGSSGEKKKTSRSTARKTPAKRKSTTSKRGKRDGDEKVEGERGDPEIAEEEEVDEEGFVDDMERKKQKTVHAAHTKGTRSKQSKVPEAVTAAKRQLQSKNVEAKLAERKRGREAAAAVSADTSTASQEEKRNDGKGRRADARKRSKQGFENNSHGSDSAAEDDSDQDLDNFAPSHWDLLAAAERLQPQPPQWQQQQQQQQQQQRQQQQSSPRKAGSAYGMASSLTARVSASNAARYGGSFRNKETGGGSKGGKKTRADNKQARVLQ
ncbi:DNA repair protein rad2 [Mortierella claussenii]|nr:DNA repair protein rad2 [Mortierella claussenii]